MTLRRTTKQLFCSQLLAAIVAAGLPLTALLVSAHAETPSCGAGPCGAAVEAPYRGSDRAQLAPEQEKPAGESQVLGGNTPPAPPPPNAITAPSNRSAQPKSPVLSAPAAAETTPDGAISAPSENRPAPASGVISAPSGAAPAGSVPAITAPRTADPEQPADPGLSVKQSLFHDLNMKNIRAKKDYGLKIDIAPIEELCLKKPSSVAECRKAVDEMSDKIDAKIHDAETLRTQQNSVRLDQERNDLLAEQNRIQAEKPDVVVIERGRKVHHRDLIGQPAGTVVESSGFGLSGSVGGPNGSVSFQGGSGATVTSGNPPINGGDTPSLAGQNQHPPTVSPPGPFAKPNRPTALPTPRR